MIIYLFCFKNFYCCQRRSPFSSTCWNCLWSLQWKDWAWKMNHRQWIWRSRCRRTDSPLSVVADPHPAHPQRPPSLPSIPRRSPLETKPSKRCLRGRKWSYYSPRSSSCWSIPPLCSLSETETVALSIKRHVLKNLIFILFVLYKFIDFYIT